MPGRSQVEMEGHLADLVLMGRTSGWSGGGVDTVSRRKTPPVLLGGWGCRQSKIMMSPGAGGEQGSAHAANAWGNLNEDEDGLS